MSTESVGVPAAPGTNQTAEFAPDFFADPATERRNFLLVALNGVLTGGPSMLFDPNTVLAAFIVHAGGSQALIGLVSALVMLGWVGPQLWVANWVEPKPRKLFVYRRAAIVRIGSLATVATLMWVFRAGLPAWFLFAMISLLFLYWGAGGFSAVAWYEVLSKTVRASRRPTVFAWRMTGAGVVALLAGIVVSWALGPHSGMVFPTNYCFLLTLMTVLMAIGVGTFTIVREPSDTMATQKRRRPWREYFRLGPKIMREDRNYRRLVMGQVAFGTAVMITPFLVPFLITRVGADDSVIGVLMAAAAGTDLIVNIYWGRLGSKRGNRAVLVRGSQIAALCPLAALAAPLLPAIDFVGVDARIVVIGAALVMSRVAGSGIGVGRMNYLLDIAPQGIRPSYIGFMNTFSIIPTIMPIVAGNVIEVAGYVPVFALAAVFGILTFMVIIGLEDIPNGHAGTTTSALVKRSDDMV